MRILLVSDEPIEVLRDFVRTHEVELPIHAASGGVPSVLFPHGRPTTFVVDYAGQVVLRHSGAADWGQPEVAEYLRHLATGC